MGRVAEGTPMTLTTNANPVAPLIVKALGRMDYQACLELQRELASERAEGRIEDTLLLVEHDPVITIGRRRGSVDNVLAAGDWPVIAVERGGDVTWHGPGQLVGYPIVLLREGERDLHEVLRRLEEALIVMLSHVGVAAERRPKFTGVWAGGKKLVSLGVAVRRWVTIHGFALNVSPDLGAFDRINPCGMDAGIMGSIASLGVDPPAWAELEALAARCVAEAFGRSLVVPAGTP